jgi:hypothetical protein
MVMSAISEQKCASFTAEIPYLSTGTHERVVPSGAYYDANHHQRMTKQGIATTKASLKMIESCMSSASPTLRVTDMHTPGGQFYADSTRVKFLDEASMVPTLLRMIRLRGLHKDAGFAIVFLDAGAAKKYRARVGDMPFITCDKVRGVGSERVITIADYQGVTKESKLTNLWLVDDLVQSGSTLGVGCKALTTIFPDATMSAWVTHGVFPNDSYVHFAPGGKFGRRVNSEGKLIARGFREFFVCDTVPEVANKLRQMGAPFHIVDTTPMNVQCYLEQYGWIKDPRAASFYAPLQLIVCSGNKDKVEAVYRAFYTHFPQKPLDTLYVNPIASATSGIAEQPVGLDETERGCNQRLLSGLQDFLFEDQLAEYRPDTLDKIQTWLMHNVPNKHTCYAVAMERGLFLRTGTQHEWMDQTCVKVARVISGKPIQIATVWSRALPIEREYVESALACGRTKTAGSFKSAKEGCSASDWYQHAHGVSCVDLMQESIQAGIGAIQAREAAILGAF